MTEKEMYKYALVNGELKIRKGIGFFSDVNGSLIDFVYECGNVIHNSHCNRYASIPIDKDGYYKSTVYLDKVDDEKAIQILLKHQEEMSFNYHKAYEESERKIRYLKDLISKIQHGKPE